MKRRFKIFVIVLCSLLVLAGGAMFVVGITQRWFDYALFGFILAFVFVVILASLIPSDKTEGVYKPNKPLKSEPPTSEDSGFQNKKIKRRL